jgi:hypothetical protein
MRSLSAVGRPINTAWSQEPVAIQALIMSFVNLMIVFGVVQFTDQQIGAINMFLAALLAVLARRAVTPVANPRDQDGNRLVPDTRR